MLLFGTPRMTAVASHEKPRRPHKAKAKASHHADDDVRADVADAAVVDEDDATRGDWLFKQDDLVLGPVTAIVLVDKIKKGELSGDTPIARDGAAFRPMKLVRLFREAWQAIEEEKRLAAEERAFQGAVTRARLGRVVVVLLMIAVPAAAAAVAARQLMVLRPWDDTPVWVAKVPPLVDLPQKPIEVKKVDPAAVVASATPAGDEDEPDDPSAPRDPSRPRKPKVKSGDPKNPTTTAATPEPATPAAVESLTNAQAVAPLKDIQGDLKTCFKAEIDSNPDMPAQVVLSYTITEEGKAINVNLDARELRGRPVVGCVQKAVGGVRWPRFTGERKNVSVPFKLGKPKPTGK